MFKLNYVTLTIAARYHVISFYTVTKCLPPQKRW